METIETQTPANALEANNASFLYRLAATLIDSIVSFFLSFLLGYLLGLVLEPLLGDMDETTKEYVISFADNTLSLLIFAWLESSKWQATPGKYLVSLKVETVDGRRLTFGQAIVRTLAKIPAAIILFIGFFAMLWSPRRLTWFDSWTNTRVRRHPDPKSSLE